MFGDTDEERPIYGISEGVVVRVGAVIVDWAVSD